MSAAHKKKLREAMANRRAQIAAGTLNPTAHGTGGGTGGGITRMNPIDTLRSAARGSWTADQIGEALRGARREVAVLEALERAALPQAERTMSAGGGYNQGNV